MITITTYYIVYKSIIYHQSRLSEENEVFC